jgi:Flp pilus assembly protein TadG
MICTLRRILRFGRCQEGAAALEFALCLLPLLLIVGGIIDFGHAWYMESVLGTASREGARYATRYKTDPVKKELRLSPNSLSPSVEAYITTNYGGLFPHDANLTVTPGGAGFSSTTAGLPVSVQVTADKHWFFLSSLIPGLTNPKTLISTTWMSLE